jgi:integrase/recombinase XerD
MPLKPKTVTSRTTKATKGRIFSSSDDVVDARVKRKIEYVVEGLPSRCLEHLCNRVLPGSKENVLIICDYISSLKSEINPSNNYRKDTIILLCKFSIFLKNKTFNRVTRNDVLSFLDSFRKIETVDSLHKWIGTYNLYRIGVMRFFKWLYYPDIEQTRRPKPPIIENIPRLKRKEKSIYKPTDLWTPKDDLIFLKYCPSARDRCYHTMSRDSAARPHELLKLRIKDVVFRLSPENKKQYAEIRVNGKTGIRYIPLIDSIPYIKDWLSQHPQSANPDSILFSGFGRSLGRTIHESSLRRIYQDYKEKFFPKLVNSTNVLPEDKQKIKELLKKPWNPYIRRHSSLTEKSTILKEHTLRQFAGWSPGSNMHLKYLQYFGNESTDSILEASGIISKDKQLSDALRPKQCPNCGESNKPDSRFCAKCRIILTYDAYHETIEQKQEKEKQIAELTKRQERFENLIQSLIDSGQLKPLA